MALAESVQALAAGSFVLARQRLELATLDVEEQLLRATQILVRLLVAVALGTLALAALAATVVVGLWESSRMAALVGVTAVFAVAAALAVRAAQRAAAARPPLLGATLDELKRDGEHLAHRP